MVAVADYNHRILTNPQRNSPRNFSPSDSYLRKSKCGSSRGKVEIICSSLDANHFGQVGPKYSVVRTDPEVQVSSSFVKAPKAHCSSKLSGKEHGSLRRGQKYALQRSNRISFRFGSRFLFARLRGAEKIRGSETSDRSENVEPVFSGSSFSDGVCPDNSSSTSNRGICSLSGHERRIFSYPRTPQCPEIHAVHSEGQDLSVPSNVFRSCSGSTDFYQTTQTSSSISPEKRDKDIFLHRRLADRVKVKTRSARSCRKNDGVGSTSGYFDKFTEVRLGSQTNFYPSGSTVQSGSGLGFSNQRSSFEGSNLDQVPQEIQSGNSTRLPVISRVVEPYLRYDSSGETPFETTTVFSKDSVASSQRSVECCNSTETDFLPGSSLVGKCSKSEKRSFVALAGSSDNGDNRCKWIRMGGPLFRSDGLWGVDASATIASHQHSRNDGGDFGSDSFFGHTSEQMCHDSVRQYDSSVLYKETGRKSLSSDVRSDKEALSMGSGEQDVSLDGLYSGQTKCSGRQIESLKSNPTSRMDSFAISVQPDLFNLPIDSSRPICDIF